MIGMIKEYLRKAEQKKLHMIFYEEAKANLEAYYVMFQINRLRFFTLNAWDKVKDLSYPELVLNYIRRLTAYHQALQDYKDYEQWYNENLERKNQDNGRILHKKKELAQEQFDDLELVIKSAVVAIEDLC